jgi:hypothetical protein
MGWGFIVSALATVAFFQRGDCASWTNGGGAAGDA